jgi:signal peptidase II
MKRSHILFVALGVVILDQLSKAIIKTSFHFTTNTGAAFGIFKNYQWFIIVVAIIVALAIIYYLAQYPYPELGLILGGTVGNLIDRVVLGHVIDFIALGWWPSFNVADSANTIGVALLIFRMINKS